MKASRVCQGVIMILATGNRLKCLAALMNLLVWWPIIVFAAQLLFIFNFFYSIFKGRKVTDSKPMGRQYPGMDNTHKPFTWKLAGRNSRGSPLGI